MKFKHECCWECLEMGNECCRCLWLRSKLADAKMKLKNIENAEMKRFLKRKRRKK